MAEDELSHKQAFFELLETITGENRTVEKHDQGLHDSMAIMGSQAATERPFVRAEHASTSTHFSSSPLQRCNSAIPVDEPPVPQNLPNKGHNDSIQPLDQAGKETVDSVEVVEDTPVATNKVQNNVRLCDPSTTMPNVKPSTHLKATGKRKRGAPTAQISESRKIFKGLHFFFVPNNDIAAPRRRRIEKAIEYGAEWVSEWRPSVISHVIVDKPLTYADVIKFLKLSKWPIRIIMVNEDYTADCIADGVLVDPTLRSLQVKGYKDALEFDKSNPDTSKEPRQKRQEVIKKQHGFPTAQNNIEEVQIDHPETIAPSSTEPSVLTAGQEDPAEGLNASVGSFQEAVASAKAVAHLPLDSDDEDQSSPSCSFSTDNLSKEKRNSGLEKAEEKSRNAHTEEIPHWQHNFQCMKAHSHDTEMENNPNIHTINILQEMLNYYSSVQDQWRTRAYRMAIGTLKKETRPITTKEEARNLKFIGAKLAAKIEEIYWTNRLQQLETSKLQPIDETWHTFINVYGASFAQASKWVQEGHKTLQDLLCNAKLTPSQKVGVEHYHDFLSRIPRSEVAQLGAIVQSALYKIDPDFETIIGGSFRRGSKDSGDVDILITKRDADGAYLRTVIIETLVPNLQKRGFLVAALAVTGRNNGSKWHGACQLPLSNELGQTEKNTNPWRRIDFLLVPYCELGAAKIYFTGNDLFNRSMRLLARKRGMRLNQRGLYKDVLRDGAKRLTEGTKIEGESEEGIFNALGVPWSEAWERNI